MKKLGTAERRKEIMIALCRRRHDTVNNLAFEFGVSARTIRRDIEVLSLKEPIYTRMGRYGGGIYVMDGYYIDRMYISDDESEVLVKVFNYAVSQGALDSNEIQILRHIIEKYTKPKTTKK